MKYDSPHSALGALLLYSIALVTATVRFFGRLARGTNDRAATYTLTATALIPAHNEAATIVECIRALEASTYPIDQIIVVADACTDATAQVARHAGATVLEGSWSDKAAAQNAALPSITTDLVVGIDADTFVTPTAVVAMIRRMERDRLDAACATLLPTVQRGLWRRSRATAYATGRMAWRAAQSVVGRPQVLTGACYTFRTDAIKAVGGFQTVGTSADMATTWTLMEHGYRLAYVGEAIAYTIDPPTWATYRTQMRRWAAGYAQNIIRYRHMLTQPRSILVVWTALFDLICLPVVYGVIIWRGVTEGLDGLAWVPIWFGAHLVLVVVLAQRTIGWRNALLGVGPYTIVNVVNKALYGWALFREVALGIHLRSWVGRTGRPFQFSPANPWRVASVLVVLAMIVGVASALVFAPSAVANIV